MTPHRGRNIFVAAGLLTLFGILLFARLSPLQGYALAGCFIALAGYAIALGFRD
jgi:hypothetical protein